MNEQLIHHQIERIELKIRQLAELHGESLEPVESAVLAIETKRRIYVEGKRQLENLHGFFAEKFGEEWRESHSLKELPLPAFQPLRDERLIGIGERLGLFDAIERFNLANRSEAEEGEDRLDGLEFGVDELLREAA